FMHSGSKVERAAIVSDVRGGAYFDDLSAVLEELDGAGVRRRLIFLDADQQTPLNRYKETRRRHPLAPTGSAAEGLPAEQLRRAPPLGGDRRTPRGPLPRARRLHRRRQPPRHRQAPARVASGPRATISGAMIDHVGFEVADLERSGRFYDAVFSTLGVRRMHSSDQAIAYGITDPTFWITARAVPARQYGHIALRAVGKVAVDAAHAAALRAGG